MARVRRDLGLARTDENLVVLGAHRVRVRIRCRKRERVPGLLERRIASAGTAVLSATALATGISIQDVPEGLVVALALRGEEATREHALQILATVFSATSWAARRSVQRWVPLQPL